MCDYKQSERKNGFLENKRMKGFIKNRIERIL